MEEAENTPQVDEQTLARRVLDLLNVKRAALRSAKDQLIRLKDEIALREADLWELEKLTVPRGSSGIPP